MGFRTMKFRTAGRMKRREVRDGGGWERGERLPRMVGWAWDIVGFVLNIALVGG